VDGASPSAPHYRQPTISHVDQIHAAPGETDLFPSTDHAVKPVSFPITGFRPLHYYSDSKWAALFRASPARLKWHLTRLV
jgi:hypothetical protein